MQPGVEISLRIGQRVRHCDTFHGKRVTGVITCLSLSENVLNADIALDEAIVIPPTGPEDRELRIYRQFVPAHELTPFDEREELIGEMLGLLLQVQDGVFDADPVAHSNWLAGVDAAVAKATSGKPV